MVRFHLMNTRASERFGANDLGDTVLLVSEDSIAFQGVFLSYVVLETFGTFPDTIGDGRRVRADNVGSIGSMCGNYGREKNASVGHFEIFGTFPDTIGDGRRVMADNVGSIGSMCGNYGREKNASVCHFEIDTYDDVVVGDIFRKVVRLDLFRGSQKHNSSLTVETSTVGSRLFHTFYKLAIPLKKQNM
jgi:hypothetical protein